MTLLRAFGIRSRQPTRDTFATTIKGTGVSVQSNVIRSNGISSGSSMNNSIIKIPSRNLTYFVNTVQELKYYEQFSLCQNIIKILTDYVYNQLDLATKQYVDIPDEPQLETRVNNLIKSSGYNNKFIKDISEVIYFGGKGYAIQDVGTRSLKFNLVDIIEPYIHILSFDYTKRELSKPYSTFLSDRGVEIKYNVVINNSLVELAYEDILFIGDQNFKLVDDREARNVIHEVRQSDKVTIEQVIDNYSLYAGKPLFYSVLDDLKDYLTKKVLSTILSTKEVLMPIFMRLGVDLNKSTSTDKINETINEIESKINESVDTSMVLGSTLDINSLITQAFGTVRLLPDPGNLLTALDTLNLDPLSDKLESLRTSLETIQDSILDDIGIPSDLFDGGSNAYEVATRNQRFNSTLGSILAILRKTYKDNTIKLYLKRYPNSSSAEIQKIDEATYRIFRLSSLDLAKDANIIEQNQDVADSIEKLVSTFKDMMEDNPLIDREAAFDLLKLTLGNLGTKYKDLVIESLPPPTAPEEPGNTGGSRSFGF